MWELKIYKENRHFSVRYFPTGDEQDLTEFLKFYLDTTDPQSNDPSDWIRVELGMATIEGIGMRFLRNPDLNFDLVCELLAERIYTPREKLKQKIKELESKAA